LDYLRTRKYVSAYDLARDLNIGEHEVELILGLLLSEGVIVEYKYKSACNVCPLGKTCIKSECINNLRIFRLKNYRK